MPPDDMNVTTSSTPLSDYVRAHITRAGLSHNQLAKRARDAESGNKILVQWLIDMISGQVSRAPELWRLRALAAAMATSDSGSVDPEAYRRHLDAIKRLTAAQWFELNDLLEVATSDGSIVTISVPPDLSDEDRQKLIQWAETMAKGLAAERSR